jgi:hypothetical protein
LLSEAEIQISLVRESRWIRKYLVKWGCFRSRSLTWLQLRRRSLCAAGKTKWLLLEAVGSG